MSGVDAAPLLIPELIVVSDAMGLFSFPGKDNGDRYYRGFQGFQVWGWEKQRSRKRYNISRMLQGSSI